MTIAKPGDKTRPTRRLLGLLLCAAAWIPHVALAQTPAATPSVAEFYKGREIRLLIGHPAGGGYDVYGRFLARYLPKFLPGAPSIVAQNMPGAAGLVAANYIYSQAPRDGTVIGAGPGSLSVAALFGNSSARFDSRRFAWIGSLNSEVGLAVARADAPVKKAADLFDHELIVGGAGATDESVVFPLTLNRLLGTKFKLVPGYGGSADIALAIDRGEVQGVGSWHYSSILATRPQWLRDKTINILLQLALHRHPALPDAPTAIDLARNPDERTLLELVFAQQDMGRPFFAPPDIPEDRARALRGAFAAMIADPDVLAAARDQNIEINRPMRGEDIASLVTGLYAARPDLVKRAAEATTTAPAK